MDSGAIYEQTTICARATAPGQGAIAVVRISGPEAVTVLERVYRPMKEEGGVRAAEFRAREMHYGRIVFPEGNAAETVIDEVMAVVFRAPHSYTGEDSAEIYCHGSQYIVSEILRALIAAGAEMASAGEFTKRAFLNGRMDLAQAEAVADLIASENRAAHDIALQQLRGGYSSELQEMRSEMLDIVSLMELELDFSEEDVEFADRTRVLDLIDRVSAHISRLADSFALGNAIKNGIPVAIVGAVNTGKSTLLNALLGEDRAIVSDIAGTTRDTRSHLPLHRHRRHQGNQRLHRDHRHQPHLHHPLESRPHPPDARRHPARDLWGLPRRRRFTHCSRAAAVCAAQQSRPALRGRHCPYPFPQ